MTPKSFEEINDTIVNLTIDETTEEILNEILNDIANVEDELQQIELYNNIILKRKEQILTKAYENENELKKDIENFVTIIENKNLRLEELIFKHGFTFENILKEREVNGQKIETTPKNVDSRKEIEIIEERIIEIEDKYLNLARYSIFKLELESKLNELEVSISNIDDEEEKNTTKAMIEELQKEIEILSNSNNYLSREAIIEIAEKYDISIDEIENIIRSENPDIKEELHSIEELEQELANLNGEFNSLQTELSSVEEEIERLNNDISISVENISLTEEEKKEMQAITAELSKRENKYGRMTEEELQEESKKLKDIINIKKVMIGEEQRELLKIEQELAKRKNPNGMSLDELRKKYNDMSLDDLIDEEKRLKDIINIKKVMIGEEQKQLQELQSILSKRENKYGRMTEKELQEEAKKLKDIINIKKVMVGEEQRELSKIEEELEKRSRNDFSNISKQNLQKRLEELEKKSKNPSKNKEEIQKQLDEKKKQRDNINNKLITISDEINKKVAEKLEAQELLDFKAIKNAYNKILLDGIKTFENSNDDEFLQENIEQFVKTHPGAEKFNNYERKDKLINELINDIHDKVRNKTVTKTEKKPKVWIKALAGATGFITGLGLSCVPGVGTIRMTIAGVKLATAITDKAINIWTKNHPNGKVAKITAGVREKFKDSWLGKKTEMIREKLKHPYAQWAMNGLAAGYIAGNIYELLKGETLWESIKTEPKPEDIVLESEIIPDKIIPDVEIPKAGDVLDLSELEFGRISSDAEKAVHLMEGIGKEVEFDKIKVLSDGTEMWHFKQLNGNGYAWFPKEEVMEILKKQAEKAAKLANSRIM